MRNAYSNDKPRNQYSLGEDSVIHMRTMDTYRALTLTCVISLAYQNDETVLYPISFAIHVSYAIHSLATCMRSLRNNETDRYFRNRESEIWSGNGKVLPITAIKENLRKDSFGHRFF